MTDSQKLDLLLENVLDLKKDMSELKERVGSLEEHVSSLEARMTSLEEHVSSLEARISNLERDVDDMKICICNLEKDVKVIRLDIENDLRVSIKRVAEAHLDLSRGLSEAKRPSEEMETLSIRVRKNESDIRDIYNRLSKYETA